MEVSELKNCPFCGSAPSFPEAKEVFGTFYEAGCEDCGIARISLQIIDCFDRPRDHVHESWDDEKIQYGIEYIQVTRQQAIDEWNTRASPWIPCKDRLPEIPKGRFAVQVDAWYWADGPSGKDKEVHVMMFRNEVFFEGIWSEVNGHEWIESFYPVEGWMYRPVPPDKDEA